MGMETPGLQSIAARLRRLVDAGQARKLLNQAELKSASRSALTREPILRASARQSAEGNIQHRWQPHSRKGVPTHISEERAWLSQAVRILPK
jgi:hypothetical protein